MKLFFFLVTTTALIIILLAAPKLSIIPQKRLCFESKACVWIQLADTPEKRQAGLSNKVWMPHSVGILFIFDAPSRPSFWMKDMRFDLDFIWLFDNQVVDITPNVPRPTTQIEALPRYLPSLPSDSMLEVNAGWSEQNHIQIGDTVVLK